MVPPRAGFPHRGITPRRQEFAVPPERVARRQTKRDRKTDGRWAFYARHTLTCRSTDGPHDWWEPLTPTHTDEVHKFNRSDYLRVLPPTDPDYSRVYGMRADTESLNAQFERAFYNRRLPAWGLHNAAPKPAL